MSKPHKRLSFVLRIVLILNWFAVGSLLLAYAACYINPSDWVLPAFFGLAYPYLLVINLGFIVCWICVRKFYFLVSLFVVLLGWNLMGRIFQVGVDQTKASTVDTTFSVLSYNVHNLLESNTDELIERQNNIFEYLINESPDITCLQEFFSFGANYYYPLVYLKEKLKADNYYFQSYYNPYKEKIVGMAIFSKLPRVNRGIISHDSTRSFGIFADFVLGQDTFRVYNIHLESIYLGVSDYEILTGTDIDQLDRRQIKRRSSRLINKLKKAFVKRAYQVGVLKEHMQNCTYPVIICGDFNDTPTSYAYTTLADNLEDSFISKGTGIGNTFAGKAPFFRIDYILYDTSFTCLDYWLKESDISDHMPVSCIMGR